MIKQGFAERRHEAIEPASPLPVWEGASHSTHKQKHLFPEAAWGSTSSQRVPDCYTKDNNLMGLKLNVQIEVAYGI